jgi:hypothetical protein
MKIRTMMAVLAFIAMLIPLTATADTPAEQALPPKAEHPVGYHAARWGLSIEEGRFQLELQDFAGVVVGEALSEYGQDVVMEMTQRPAGVIVYTAHDNDRVRQIVKNVAGVRAGYFRVVPAQATQAELETRAAAAWRAMGAEGIAVASTVFDIRNGLVSVRTPTPEQAISRININGVVFEEGQLAELEVEGYGGWYLNSGCNAGFVANSGAGYITANHCPNWVTTSQHPNGSPTANVTYSHGDLNDDVQYETFDTPDNGGRFFWIGWTHQAVYSKTWSHPISASVCHYGDATGAQCGTITDSSVAPSIGLSTYFVEADCSCSNFSSGGDSGGPWYSGSTAYGIHHGSPGYGTTAWYQKITRAESELSVTLWEY